MSLISTLKNNSRLILQYLVVVVAFVFMVIIGSYFASSIVNDHLVNYGREVISASVETLETYLTSHKNTFESVAFAIEDLNISDAAQIELKLAKWTNWLNKNTNGHDYVKFYGVINGTFVHSLYWVPPDDYNPETRPWYTGAVENPGETFLCDPYIDAQTHEWVLSLSKVLFDYWGNPFGVISVDVFLTAIASYVNNMHLLNYGYGVLLDSDLRVIANPDESNFYMRLENIDNQRGGFENLSNLLRENEELDAYHYVSASGVDSVLFARKLSNGWYVYVSSPITEYYRDVNVMRIVLSLAALISILILCGILTILYKARIRSDASNKFKSTFLANMSHEIRTPMNAIIGMSDLLLNSNPVEGKPITKRDIDCVNDINISAHSLLTIINGILDLSKIEAGKMTVNPAHYDFYMLIDNIVSMFSFITSKKGLEFKVFNDEQMPRYLFGDDIKLRQVLINILGNAVKYTSKGFVGLNITTSMENRKIWFEIQDSGFGVRKEDIPHLFNAFEQIKDQKNRNIIGTGLGLPISKAFIEMMGGTITFESDYGTGSVFNIIIPIEEGDESKVSRESASQKTQAISAPDALVLVVDDNEFNLKVAEGLLELFKVKAVLASSGQEALEMIKNANFDIIFMDHMMPDMDGLETTAEIRVWEKGRRKGSSSSQKRIPVIALTANAVQGSREMFLEHDMDDFLSKPIEIPILARILSDWLPPEKITIKHETDTTSAKDESISKEDSTSLETVNTISEINLETGLSRVNGRKDMYLNNLKLFKERIAPDNKKMTDLLNSSDIKNFSITVHAIKSALASIGAEQLSNIALALENSSKEGNAEYCKQNFPSFSERLSELDEELSKAFSPADKKAKAGKTFTSEKEAIAYLKENLQKALDAIDDFDNDEGIDALNNLLACKYDNEIKELLEKAVAELKRFKYKEAKDILAQL